MITERSKKIYDVHLSTEAQCSAVALRAGALFARIKTRRAWRCNFCRMRAPKRSNATGPDLDLPDPMRRALEPDDCFAFLPKPGPNDWVANHPEHGQTFEDFLAARPNRPGRQRCKFYLQPLGSSDVAPGPSVEDLRSFASAFFMRDVIALPHLDLRKVRIRHRNNPFSGQLQLCTTDILHVFVCGCARGRVRAARHHNDRFVPGPGLEICVRPGITAESSRSIQLRPLRSGVLWRIARASSAQHHAQTQCEGSGA